MAEITTNNNDIALGYKSKKELRKAGFWLLYRNSDVPGSAARRLQFF